jgi:hypothetical protein
MPSRTIAVKVTVKDRAGNSVSSTVDVLEQTPNTIVAGGYYVTGNGDMRADTVNQGMNLRSFTQYHSFADANTVPGWNRDYLKTFVTQGIWGNFVLELKHYGAAAGPQTINGKTVPAPNMTIQQRSGTTWPPAYGYGQVTSGVCNPLFERAVAQINAMPGTVPFNIQLASEFDTDHEFGITEAGVAYTWAQADARAIPAINYIIDFMKARITRPNVTFTIGMGGFDRPSWLRMHPESLANKVDYLQWNVYRRAANETAYNRFMRTKIWTDADLGPLFRKKDILIAEWGTPMSLGDQATWIRTVSAAIDRINSEATTGKIVMTNYFNSNDGWATLNPKQAGLDALKLIYGQTPYKG